MDEDLNNLTMVKLRTIARENGLKGYSKKRKAELINFLRENLRPQNQTWSPLLGISETSQTGARSVVRASRTRPPRPTRPPPPPQPRDPNRQEMDIFEQQEMRKSRSEVKNKLVEWGNWLMSHVPKPIRDRASKAFKTFKDGVMSLYNKVTKKESELSDAGAVGGEEESTTDEPASLTRMRLVENKTRIKTYAVTGDLNRNVSDIIMETIRQVVEMRTKVIYSFHCSIFRGQNEVVEYYKTFANEVTFTGLRDIESYIRHCELKRLDLDNAEVWNKAYLPATVTIDNPNVYEGRVEFKRIYIKLISSNEPLLGCGPLPDWLREKRCVYALDNEKDNLCIWRCLVISKRIRENQQRPERRTTRDALQLAREFYNQPNLAVKCVLPTKLIDFERIAAKFQVNIRLYEPIDQSTWKLVFGQNQFRASRSNLDIGLYEGHCFFIKDINLLANHWECAGCQQRFTRHDNYHRHATEGRCTGGQTKLLCPGDKFKGIMNSSEKVFYGGGNTQFSFKGCRWIEKQSENIGKHIHHALCSHGGERCVTYKTSEGKEVEIMVDGFDPASSTVYQFHGCKWHGCPCQGTPNHPKYQRTIERDNLIRSLGYNVISVWECESPSLSKEFLKKGFIPYPNFIVFDFEAILKKLDLHQTDDLTIDSQHVPVSVAINDNLTNEPIFLENSDPEDLIKEFLEEILRRQELISKEVWRQHPMQDEDSIPMSVRKKWGEWVNQVPVLGFNSGKYDINMIKEYFVRSLSDISDVTVAKKDNSYMFLTTPKLKFLDVRNYLTPGLSYAGWCKANGCALEKLFFPYEWLDSYEKLNHLGPVPKEAFYSSLKGEISSQEYEEFVREFYARGCVTMMDWLREYNLVDVIPFIEAVDKTRKQYYPDEIDMLKDAVSIPGISMTYVLNKALTVAKGNELYAPGLPCAHTCEEHDYQAVGCRKCKRVRNECNQCPKNKPYELLKTGMIGGPSIVFCRYAEVGKTKIRSHQYGDSKRCESIVGFDANSLYLYCSGQEMPCGKEQYFEVEDPTAVVEELCKEVLNGNLFGYLQVDIEVPDQLRDKFREFSPLFMVDSISQGLVPTHMKEYQERTNRKTLNGSKKLLGVLRAKKILLYTPLLKWYLEHGLKVTAIYKYLAYTAGKPFSWFPEEVSSVRRNGDENPALKQLGDTHKLKGNSFYGKMIEDLSKHVRVTFTRDEDSVDKVFRSPFFEDLEEINEAYEISECKRRVSITRPYQCGIAVYQLAKLRMLEFYYDFLDVYFERRDFELIQMDTDSLYMALSGSNLDELVKPYLKEDYQSRGKAKFLSTSKYHDRTPGLFKAEFQGTRMIVLTSKCYFAENQTLNKKKFSCKGVNKRQNEMHWGRYYEALRGSIDIATNTGFRAGVKELQPTRRIN